MSPVSHFLAVTEEDKKYMKQCRKCGAWSPLASEACTTCGGMEFRGHKAPKEKKVRRELGRTTASPVEARKVCQTCGTSNPEYVKNYCVRCGARL
jgi:ribosomal protein L40E